MARSNRGFKLNTKRIGGHSSSAPPPSSAAAGTEAAKEVQPPSFFPAGAEEDEPEEASSATVAGSSMPVEPAAVAAAVAIKSECDDADVVCLGDVAEDEVAHTVPASAARAAPGRALTCARVDVDIDEVPCERGAVEALVLPGEADIKSYEITGWPAMRSQGYFDFASFFPSCPSITANRPFGPAGGYEVCGLGDSVVRESSFAEKSGAEPWDSRRSKAQLRALILFDWDDTLCPTSWIEDHPELGKFFEAPMTSPRKSEDTWSKLKELSRAVANLVSTALTLGDVALVTLAERPWVPVAIQEFMPEVGAEVAALDVFYARELAAQGPIDPGLCPWTTMKRLAMQEAMKTMEAQYGVGGELSWKSFISVGDSEVEKRAAQQLGTACKARGKVTWTKTVKFAAQPDVTHLISEVRAMNDQIVGLVAHPGHKDVNVMEWLSER